MNINRFTEKSQDALREAQSVATRRNNQGVDVEHLFAALLEQRDGLAPAVLQAAGANIELLTQRLNQDLDRLPHVSGPAGAPEQIYVTQRLNRVLTRAEDEAAQLKDEYVSIEHLLLAARRPRPSGSASRTRPTSPGRDRLNTTRS